MTRVNLIDPELLMDQHLIAEYCEIPMVLSSLERSIKARGITNLNKIIPPTFTLNKGHVSFFYDKLKWLERRYKNVHDEILHRGFNTDKSKYRTDFDLHLQLFNEWVPSDSEVQISKARIDAKVALKPDWYRYTRE